ncbi:hypothetical protein [Deinococcus hopiensis]|nr:hypothetical protein [Deinococcus hopiensis]
MRVTPEELHALGERLIYEASIPAHTVVTCSLGKADQEPEGVQDTLFFVAEQARMGEYPAKVAIAVTKITVEEQGTRAAHTALQHLLSRAELGPLFECPPGVQPPVMLLMHHDDVYLGVENHVGLRPYHPPRVIPELSPAEMVAQSLEDLAARLRSGELQPWSISTLGDLKQGIRVLEQDLQGTPGETQPSHLSAMVVTFVDPFAEGGVSEPALPSRQRAIRPQLPEVFLEPEGQSGEFLEVDAEAMAQGILDEMSGRLRRRQTTVWRGMVHGGTVMDVAKAAIWLEREYHDLPGLKGLFLPYLEEPDYLYQGGLLDLETN